MTDQLNGTVVQHPVRILRPLAGRGFAVEEGSRLWLQAKPAAEGWQVADEGGETWQLKQLPARRGFVLLGEGGDSELGRTMPLVGADQAALRFLLLEDGRLFQIVHRITREGGAEIRGWETPGAYLEVETDDRGWRLLPTVAAGGLKDLRAICVLLAAELLAAEEPTSVEDA